MTDPDVRETLPLRDIPELIEALRIRALRLIGAEWERNATRDMMNEAAHRLEVLGRVLEAALKANEKLVNDLDAAVAHCAAQEAQIAALR